MSKREKSDGDPGDVPSKKTKHVGGNRCVVYGCSNTMYDGFAIHELPRHGPMRRAWTTFIQRRRKDFNINERVHVVICSGHFDREQYEPSQVMQYKYGYRKNTPRLLANAIPNKQHAVQPFPEDWFIKSTPTPTPSTSTPTTSTLSVALCRSSSSTNTVHSTSMAVSFLQQQRQSSSGGAHVQDHPITFADASTCTSLTEPTKSGTNKRRVSVLSRKKEVQRITEEYARKEEEEAAEAAAVEEARRERENNKAVQFSPIVHMVDKQLTKKPKTRTCGAQVKPSKPVKPVQREKGVQTTLPLGFGKADRAVLMKTSETQTEKLHEDAEQETFEEPEDEHDPDDKQRDPDYEPESELEDKAAEGLKKLKMPADIVNQPKYIVFEDQLIELFNKCRNCHLTCSARVLHPPTFGSRVKIVSTCEECDFRFEWSSQPSVGNLFAGNILLSSSLLFAGASPTKILKVFHHMNLKGISTTTFNDHQTKYLQPAIIKEWRRTQEALFDDIKSRDQGPVLGGDGRSDSPGHSAKYGSYTMMDLRTHKVIDIQLVQCTEVKNSNAMELEGLRRGLQKLDSAGVIVESMVTDRHMQIAKFLRETYPHVDHRYDVWHIAKGLKKKLKALAKMKDCELVQAWLRTLINHVYWTALSTPDGDKDVMKAKYKRAMNHIRNLHDQGPDYIACEHGEDYPDREWMKSGTKVYEKLSEIMLRTRLLNDIGMMSPHAQTSKVESFNSILLHWCPKLLVYSYQGMKCRLYVAGLHWNENCDRPQATGDEGNPVYKVKYPRSKEGGHTVEKVLTACTYDYVKALMRVVLELVENKQQIRDDMEELQPQPARSSSYQHPNKDEAVRAFEEHHRFADNT